MSLKLGLVQKFNRTLYPVSEFAILMIRGPQNMEVFMDDMKGSHEKTSKKVKQINTGGYYSGI